jgi:hypothetical protein
MLTSDEITKLVTDIARANLTREAIDRAVVEPAIDSAGQEALRITIVISPDAADKFNDDALLDTLAAVQNQLRGKSEDRFPIIEYATEDELETHGDN